MGELRGGNLAYHGQGLGILLGIDMLRMSMAYLCDFSNCVSLLSVYIRKGWRASVHDLFGTIPAFALRLRNHGKLSRNGRLIGLPI
jgi:hypothetical protein